MTDNGPQFVSAEFASFASKWGFQHVTSSPHYPQSNGRAENAVKTIKRLFSKCLETRQSEYQALLDWRNTPTEGLGSSPAQRFLGRRCRTLLPITEALLTPAYDTREDARVLKGKRAKQAHYYNRQARDLPPIIVGDAVRMRLPGEKRWTVGRCTGMQGPRSYRIQVGETEYRRNRRHLRQGGELPIADPPTDPPPAGAGDTRANTPPNGSVPDSESRDEPEPETESDPQAPNVERSEPQLRRSSRSRRPPD